tara:strand:+ start:876 stop:1439 length:564 start_codon:yes stop_codon:yes gene_type:complete
MKKIDYKWVIICLLLILTIIQINEPAKIVDKIIEVEKIVEVEVEKIIEKEIPIEVIKEKIIRIPIVTEVIKEVEKIVEIENTDKIAELSQTIVKLKMRLRTKPKVKIREIEIIKPQQAQWYLGFGYDYDTTNIFGGSNITGMYKTPGDKMFGVSLGVRSNIQNFETGETILVPYVGLKMYIRLDKDK